MKVTLIASTLIHSDEDLDPATLEWMDWPNGHDVADADHLAEFAGRACYQSFHRPNPSTAANSTYLTNTNHQQHFSILEHASATFYVTGVSRSLTHELIRHRHLSFSQQSQRFVNEKDSTFVDPPLFSDIPGFEALTLEQRSGVYAAIGRIRNVARLAREAYEEFVQAATTVGVPRKKAREAARSILPNGTETRIVVTGNIRAWREFIQKRWTLEADAEIRRFAAMVFDQLYLIAPNSVSDLTPPKEST